MDIFDIQPMLDGVEVDYGPEPSIRQLLRLYYGQVFDVEGAAKHADLYIAGIKAKADN